MSNKLPRLPKLPNKRPKQVSRPSSIAEINQLLDSINAKFDEIGDSSDSGKDLVASVTTMIDTLQKDLFERIALVEDQLMELNRKMDEIY